MNYLSRIALRFGSSIPFPLAPLLARSEPSVLLYHGVPVRTKAAGHYAFDGGAFERQIIELQRYFDLIHPDDVLRPRPRWGRKSVVLTLDDGFRNNAVVAAPILKRHCVPAIFFVSTRHVGTDRLLWPAYLQGLELAFRHKGFSFRGTHYDMTPPARADSLRQLRKLLLSLRPHPVAMYDAITNELPSLESFLPKPALDDWFAGMTEEQIGELAADPLLSVGCHTVDHAFLTHCDEEEQRRQLADCKQRLESITGRPITTVSYPSGDYDERTIDICRSLQFSLGHAVEPRVHRFSEFEIPRAGIYQPYGEVAVFKAMWARRRSNRG